MYTSCNIILLCADVNLKHAFTQNTFDVLYNRHITRPQEKRAMDNFLFILMATFAAMFVPLLTCYMLSKKEDKNESR